MTTQDVSGGEKTPARPTTWQRRFVGLPAWFYRHGIGRFFGGEAKVAGDSTKAETGAVGALPTVVGAGLIVTHIILTPFIGRRRLRWGATVEETRATMSGDELVPEPKWGFTYAVTIEAPPAEVWPWIAQIGQGRGGFYSYQTLENMVGCRIQNVAEVRAELQHPAVGDLIYLHPESPPMRVAEVEAPRSLVLHGTPVETGRATSSAAVTWQFFLAERSDGSTRLLMRGRNDYGATPMERLSFGRFPLEPIGFVMSRKMLLEIRRLAEKAT